MNHVLSRWAVLLLCVSILLLGAISPAAAARIGELTHDVSLFSRAARFFSLQDPCLRNALAGSILLGACCGLMGAFLVVRKLALMGDALSHAVLPGVALGFLWNMEKNPVAIFVGATIVGLLGAGMVQLLRSTTKHKEDAALGFVLASFFGVGICLVTMIQNLPGGAKSGLDKFLFGQAAALGPGDVTLLGVIAALCVGSVLLFFKELRVVSFDPEFALAIGLPLRFLHYGLMLLLAFAIVASLQAVGVVLVTAMLVIPAASAHLLTDRFGLMLVLSATIGSLAGAAGAFFSFIGQNLPTGPFMVLAGAAIFAAALLFAPRHGILTRLISRRSRASRIGLENTLKAVYHLLEEENFSREEVGILELAQRRSNTLEETRRLVRDIVVAGLATTRGQSVSLTPEGWRRACEIVRNHRLWELYLTNAAHISADHVHDDAEKIEHLLDEETVRRIERRLNFATRDPHGRRIPGIRDVHSREPRSRKADAPNGKN
jgi:manganese/zinc/iron transport system permease protein